MAESTNDIILFKQLRKEVVVVFAKSHKGVLQNTMDWSMQDIAWFQEDLQEKINTTVSEKWFYTYFKSQEPEKLPRIDMLNLLSQYAGFSSWNEFADTHTAKTAAKTPSKAKKPEWRITAAIALLLLVLFFVAYAFVNTKITYHFCFVDKDVQLPITGILQIEILQENESPVYLQTTENGCFSFETKERMLKFLVHSPYYKSDTIVRSYYKNQEEKVQLKADEYALILHYFSTNNVEDWSKRREELNRIILDDAVIYQVFGNEDFGIDILSKEAFINKITLPISSLRNMKILEIERQEQKISKLKFEVRL